MGGSFLTSTLTDESHRWETTGAENWTALSRPLKNEDVT